MSAKHLQVAADGLLRLLCVVHTDDLFPETLAGLLIPEDGIVRRADLSVEQSHHLRLCVQMMDALLTVILRSVFLRNILPNLG